jgi:hypothetical protein
MRSSCKPYLRYLFFTLGFAALSGLCLPTLMAQPFTFETLRLPEGCEG